VEAVCQKVIIINKGKLVATDSVENLTHRMHGTDAAAVEIDPAGLADLTQVQQRLEQVSGVSKVVAKEGHDGRLLFEVESLPGRNVRADIARVVVQNGWNLLELKSQAFSLEEVFLELTGAFGLFAAANSIVISSRLSPGYYWPFSPYSADFSLTLLPVTSCA
jgi:ABC-2 type transport system ATP-binding protein